MIFFVVGMVLGQAGVDYGVQSGSIVDIQAADRIAIRATFIKANGENVPKTFVAQIYGARAPSRGEPGFRESVVWAKKHLPIGTVVNGRAFGEWKSGVYTQLVITYDHKPVTDILDILIRAGMARFVEGRVPSVIRTDPRGYRQWKAHFVQEEAEAKKQRVGLWGSVWKGK